MNSPNISDIRDALSTPSGDTLRFADAVEFGSTVRFTELSEQPILTARAAATTISVLNVTRVSLSSTAPVTLTDFTNGQIGQEIKVRGDGQTTAQNGTRIFTNTGANKLLAANRVYTFTLFGTTWVENA